MNQFVDVVDLEGRLIKAKIPFNNIIQRIKGDRIWYIGFEEGEEINFLKFICVQLNM